MGSTLPGGDTLEPSTSEPRWRPWLRHPRALWLSLVLALVLSLPSVRIGRVGEDTAQLLAVEDVPTAFRFGFSRFRTFVFADGQREHAEVLRARGAMPWWALLEFKVAFWRPLSSALMVLDRALFGRSAPAAHLHSVAWHLALVAAAGLLFRRLFPAAAGGLALVLFALDDAHAIPTLWLANRNALVGGTLGLLAITLHVEGRERQRVALRAAALGAMALALLAGEIALGMLAYVLAYELLAASGNLGARLRAIVPVVLVVLAWLVAYKALGYGAAASTMYVDPIAQPRDWLLNLGPRLAVLLSAVLVGFPADLWMAASARPWLVLAGLVSTALFGLLLRSAWSGLTDDERRHVRWLGVGAALSLVPVTSTAPSNRLLLAGSVGGAACVAIVLRHAWRRRGAFWVPAGVLGLFHVVVAAVVWVGLTFAFSLNHARAERIQAALATDLDQTRVGSQRLVTLWMDPFTMMATPARWIFGGAPAPQAWWTLSLAPGEHLYTRTGPATLELELAQGRLLANEIEYFCRPPGSPPLDTVALDGMRVEVAERDAEGIRRVRFTFDRPLEDPSLVLLDWKDGVLRAVPPPTIGARWSVTPPPPL